MFEWELAGICAGVMIEYGKSGWNEKTGKQEKVRGHLLNRNRMAMNVFEEVGMWLEGGIMIKSIYLSRSNISEGQP